MLVESEYDSEDFLLATPENWPLQATFNKTLHMRTTLVSAQTSRVCLGFNIRRLYV